MSEFMVGDLVISDPKDKMAPAIARKNPALVTKIYVNSIGQEMLQLNEGPGGWFPRRFKLHRRDLPTHEGALEYEQAIAGDEIYAKLKDEI